MENNVKELYDNLESLENRVKQTEKLIRNAVHSVVNEVADKCAWFKNVGTNHIGNGCS